MRERLPDWEERLYAFIAGVRDRPFAWGAHDCILFACGAVAAMTGDDPAREYRGKYDSAKGAAEALRELGKGTLLKTVDSEFKRKPTNLAYRGDLIWLAGSVGVCMGATALFVGEVRLAEKAGVLMREGLIAVDRTHWQKAWTV